MTSASPPVMPRAPRAGSVPGASGGETFCTWVSTKESESLPATQPVIVTADPLTASDEGSLAPATAATDRPRTTLLPTRNLFIRCLLERRRRSRGVDARPLSLSKQVAGQVSAAPAKACQAQNL